MLHKRMFILVISVIGLTLLFGACGGRGNNQDAATDTPEPAVEEAATEVPEAEAEAEATVEEVATEASETEADAEASVEEAATEVPEEEAEAVETAAPTTVAEATEVAGEEVVAEEAASEAEAMVNPTIQVESEASVANVINNNNPYLVTLSTMGERLAWPQSEGRFWNREGELCLYTFESAASDCYVAPDTYEGYPYAFFWSPDDRYIAYTEDPVQQGYESDIWVFDTTSNEFVDLTDDGVQGSWAGAEAGSYALDYLPMWNQEDGHIYFWRSIPNPEVPISMTLSIMRIAPEGGDAELIREVQGPMGGQLILYNDEAWYMDGVSALSPNGRHVAVLSVSMEETDTDDTDDSDGLWVIDLEDTNVPPRQLATSDDFQAANVTWTGLPLFPSGLAWHASGERLVVLAQNNSPQTAVTVLYDVEVGSGDMTPFVDFSGVTDQEEYMGQPDAEGVPPRFYSPWTASMSPDNEQLLMYQNLADAAGVMVSPIPPTGEPPAAIFDSQYQDAVPTVRSSRGANGKVLMYNVVFNTTQQ